MINKDELYDFFTEHPDIGLQFVEVEKTGNILDIYMTVYTSLSEDELLEEYSNIVGNSSTQVIGEVIHDWYYDGPGQLYDNEEQLLGYLSPIFFDPETECCCCDEEEESDDPRFAMWERKYKTAFA